jgi:hypothetical protein
MTLDRQKRLIKQSMINKFNDIGDNVTARKLNGLIRYSDHFADLIIQPIKDDLRQEKES